MPGLPVFVDEQDAKILLRWLSDDKDIAFIGILRETPCST